MTETLPPSEAARRTGLTLDALRYYEREGLIGPIGRTAGGTRRYTPDDVAWIGIVTCLRDAGLGIDELRRFTTLLRGEHEPADRVAFLRRRHAELADQLARTQAAMKVLEDKIAYYGG
ncbi:MULTISPECIES: MerR family transcriptional regulator [Actinokineospora]|uniref:MerR family transcriptional regulator n=1 Tax=Actinokineospora fastidiosa TaxID=1816 RepID=A0A918GUN0_9PSEU|nr:MULTISPECIES: MerR family transcriptional regulator [Actinokineospora]UVS79268.1 HTH-type transcriptional regulator AdhR [Actinokineospora sp. UTMC 2448]GGS60099.1 MerR family transcriptional regulator [Actinokineospora fastidiosa]